MNGDGPNNDGIWGRYRFAHRCPHCRFGYDDAALARCGCCERELAARPPDAAADEAPQAAADPVPDEEPQAAADPVPDEAPQAAEDAAAAPQAAAGPVANEALHVAEAAAEAPQAAAAAAPSPGGFRFVFAAPTALAAASAAPTRETSFSGFSSGASATSRAPPAGPSSPFHFGISSPPVPNGDAPTGVEAADNGSPAPAALVAASAAPAWEPSFNGFSLGDFATSGTQPVGTSSPFHIGVPTGAETAVGAGSICGSEAETPKKPPARPPRAGRAPPPPFPSSRSSRTSTARVAGSGPSTRVSLGARSGLTTRAGTATRRSTTAIKSGPTQASAPAEAGSSTRKHKVREAERAEAEGVPPSPEGTRSIERLQVGRNGKEQPVYESGELELMELTCPGTLWMLGCGDNDDYAIGLTSTERQKETTGLVRVNDNVPGLKPQSILQIACGACNSAFLTSEGNVYTCGIEDHGALGRDVPNIDDAANANDADSDVDMSDDEYDDEACRLLATPRLLQFSPPFQDTPPKIRQVALGEGFGLCLTEEREVFMWGSFQDEEKTGRFRSKRGDWLGSNQYAFPVPELDGVTVEKVYSGPAANFCLALSTDGTLYSWGFGNSGELARPLVNPESWPRSPKLTKDCYMDMDGSFQCGVLAQFLTPLPVRLPFQKPGHVLSVACGKNVLLVVSQDHATGKTKVYASGFNRFGQLGNGMASEGFQYELLPIEALAEANIIKVAAGENHCLALSKDGILFAWGRSDLGQLGLGPADSIPRSKTNVPKPTQVEGTLQRVFIEDIACGLNHSMAKSRQGHVYTWGYTDGIDCRATGHSAPEGQDIYFPKRLDNDMVVAGVDVPIVAKQMGGGGTTSLFLVEEATRPGTGIGACDGPAVTSWTQAVIAPTGWAAGISHAIPSSSTATSRASVFPSEVPLLGAQSASTGDESGAETPKKPRARQSRSGWESNTPGLERRLSLRSASRQSGTAAPSTPVASASRAAVTKKARTATPRSAAGAATRASVTKRKNRDEPTEEDEEGVSRPQKRLRK